MSFYHKYRPQKFTDLVGQEHVRRTLTSAIRQGKTGHAYLFSGPRGVGKTTAARLLAKALNCEKRARALSKSKSGEIDNNLSLKAEGRALTQNSELNYEPCNQCFSCREITGDRSLDVIEIDAASNRGIDEIRELRDKIKFAPSKSRYKVFIIDEVHMLTKEAFNALLKTLEEPPSHAVFVMATTELHKIPATILSRVQSFNFKRAGVENIMEYLQIITKAERINLDSDALRLIAVSGDGSYRDATSILDQVASMGKDKISLSDVQEALGLAENECITHFLLAIADNNTNVALSDINQLFSEGYDLGEFNHRLVEYLRRILLYKNDNSFLEKAELTGEQKEEVKDLSKRFDGGKILKMINLFIEAGIEMKGNNLPQLPLELAVMEAVSSKEKGLSNKKIEILEPETEDQGKIISRQVSVARDHPSTSLPRLRSGRVGAGRPETTPRLRSLGCARDESGQGDQGPAVRDLGSEMKKIEIEKKSATQEVPNKDEGIGKSVDAITLKDKWQTVLGEVGEKNRSLYFILKESEPLKVEAGKLVLGIKFKIYAERIGAKKNYHLLNKVIEKVYGQAYPLEFSVGDQISSSGSTPDQIGRQDNIVSGTDNLLKDTLEIFDQ